MAFMFVVAGGILYSTELSLGPFACKEDSDENEVLIVPGENSDKNEVLDRIVLGPFVPGENSDEDEAT
jgi:hypothetical protein